MVAATAPQLKLKIGTRGSPLALAQANEVAADLERLSNGRVTGEVVTFTTGGDKLTTERLINAGGKGLFTREIDAAVDDGRCDIGVHSLKDVPGALPHGQALLAFLEREDPRDGFITTNKLKSPKDLPKGAKVGTASLRRETQTLALRPDLEIVTFRGNVQTRLKKLEDGLADATYLAMAGLNRLDMAHVAEPIAVEEMIPAAGQGIIAIAARPDDLDPEIVDLIVQLNHAETHLAAMAERAFLVELDGSCRTAMGGHARLKDGVWQFTGEVLKPDGTERWGHQGIAQADATAEELAALGRSAGQQIRASAGGDLPAFDDA
ncbi:hydroxymethylbilane synthase [Henriciella aquimarina]|uniref:hydroxymethylbilane synthase n=1 Tax=Henriciella aquimarina TaxID=545261 RepID=UPI000A020D01|nr:hydroxymethylbilane synthase [Henriciella aquimarina]